MKLFIQIKDGKPFEHPILENNFTQVFPDIDVNNLPSNFAEFKKTEKPLLGVYEKNQTVKYELGEDGICRDVWSCEKMTEEEILEKQEFVKSEWISVGNPQSWTFNEGTCLFDPPIPYPENRYEYYWDEELYQSDNTKGWVKFVEQK